MLVLIDGISHNTYQEVKIKMPTSLLTKYDQTDATDLAALRNLLDPECISLTPSIVRMWQNENDNSFYLYNDRFVLGKVFPPDEPSCWSLNSINQLDESDIEEAVRLVKDNDSSASEIRFIPTTALEKIQNNNLPYDITEEDTQYSDYIYNLQATHECSGGSYQDMRHNVRHFFSIYGEKTKIQTFEGWDALKDYKQQMYDLFEEWIHAQADGSLSFAHEKKAFDTLMNSDIENVFNDLLLVVLTYKQKVVAFSINEKVGDYSLLNHFYKANLNLSGISHYMFYACASLFAQRNFTKFNFQDDCGLEGLKAFKLKMRPESTTKLSALRF